MDHLVGEHPVIHQFRARGIAAETDLDEAAMHAKRLTVPNAVTRKWSDVQREMRDRKAAVVIRDRFSGNLHPGDDIVLGDIEFAVFNGYIDMRASDDEGGSHFSCARTRKTAYYGEEENQRQQVSTGRHGTKQADPETFS